MTDKTPQNKVETSATLAGTTDTARDSEPKSRALPQADALKARFKAGSIPLQTDFADVIDLANMGRQALGGVEGQTGLANGFTLSSMGRLELKPNAAKGISVDQDGVAIKLKTISGLTMDKDGVSVKPKADSGIELKDSAGISIKPGNGISVDEDGIAVKAEQNKGLQVNNNGVSVKVGKGMRVSNTGMIEPDVGSYGFGIVEEGVEYAPVQVNTSTNGLVVGLHQGLINTASGLSVNVGSGLQVDCTNGISIDISQVIPKGLITMYSGSSAPEGWALCNGENGTPDLRDRFIVGKGSKFTGKGEGTKSTGDTTVTGSVTVKDTKLSLDQIPSHSHNYYKIQYHNYGYYYGDSRQGMIDSNSSVSTSSSGSGMGHKHDATLTTNSHRHSIDPIPPHYALAFIMKL